MNEWLQNNRELYPVIHRWGQTCTWHSTMSSSSMLPSLLSSCLLQTDLCLPLCMRERVFMPESPLTACARVKAFHRLCVRSLAVWQINTRTQQICVNSVPLLARHIFQGFPPLIGTLILRFVHEILLEGVQRWDGLAELSVQHQHLYFIVTVNISAIYSLLTLISI